ncbi:unnamed protein product [Lactuca saligna]|uniref:Uncharacterized protein n=1 Tax=Lactuca saligna TaxID=75948 RepID=A0AA35ZDE7_LACSI|nr:unnamed protein product [Lactuca saligna]
MVSLPNNRSIVGPTPGSPSLLGAALSPSVAVPSVVVAIAACCCHRSALNLQQTPPSADLPYVASPSGNLNKRAKPSTPRPRAPSASPDPPFCASPKASITAGDLALEMQKALRHLTQGPTIPQCLEKLELLELDSVDPIRFAPYHIFGGTMNIREMWVNLPNDPQILRGWIEMTTTSLGVLKDGNIVR